MHRYVVPRVLLAMSDFSCFPKLVLGFVAGFQCVLNNVHCYVVTRVLLCRC